MTGRDEKWRRRSVEAWIELTFDEPPADLEAAVVAMWAEGATSEKVACWVLDVLPEDLVRITAAKGIGVTRGGYFNVDERRAEKQRSCDEDAARLKRGEVSAADLAAENGLFSSLDRSRARLIARRVKRDPRPDRG